MRLLFEADRYGYEIVKLVAERSGGEYELKEAAMYSSVRWLEADGDRRFYVMNEKPTDYLNGIFAPYDGVKSVAVALLAD